MVQIKWTPQAKLDLKNIADYISKDSVYYAKKQIFYIRLRTKILNTHIRIGKIVPEMELEYIRELFEGNYRIIYMIVSNKQVDILTIHHTSMDLGKKDFL